MARKPSSRGTKIEPRAVIVETRKGAIEFDFTEGSPLDKAFIRLWDILLISAIEMQMRAKANKQRTVQWLGRELLAEAVEMPASAIESWAVRFGTADAEASKKPAAKKPAAKKPAAKKPAAKKPAAKKPAAKKPAARKSPARKR